MTISKIIASDFDPLVIETVRYGYAAGPEVVVEPHSFCTHAL